MMEDENPYDTGYRQEPPHAADVTHLVLRTADIDDGPTAVLGYTRLIIYDSFNVIIDTDNMLLLL
jgi:hypothetical protein